MRGSKRQWVGVAVLAALLALIVCVGQGSSDAGPSGGKDTDERLQPYLKALREHGREPIRFVMDQLPAHDLIVFDDGMHNALEPFDFYQQLIRDPAFQRHAPAIFLEAVPINKQRHLDAYLNAADDDPRLLYPAFQDDANGRGWNLKTYFDLLRTVRTVNQALPGKSKLRVCGVDSPTFWSEIQTRQDLIQYHKSCASRDHHMYTAILNELAQFQGKRKGIFLTNTRHAFKGIRQKDGTFFWNAATFFHQWHPGKAYSISVHNVVLQAVGALATPRASFQGRQTHEYKYARVAHGLWDSAFRAAGDRPVAFPLQGNVFGAAPYVGADQLDALPGQKMQDAFDAVIFLAPLEKLHHCAYVDLCTPAYKQELKRRLALLWTEAELKAVLAKTKTKDLDELFAIFEKGGWARPAGPLPEAQLLGPIDEWKTQGKE
jgi:hypothetical protein